MAKNAKPTSEVNVREKYKLYDDFVIAFTFQKL